MEITTSHQQPPDPNTPSYQKSPHYSFSPSHNQNQGIHYEPQQPQWHHTQWIYQSCSGSSPHIPPPPRRNLPRDHRYPPLGHRPAAHGKYPPPAYFLRPGSFP